MELTVSHREFLVSKLLELKDKRELNVKTKEHVESKDQKEVAELCQIEIFLLDQRIDRVTELLTANKL